MRVVAAVLRAGVVLALATPLGAVPGGALLEEEGFRVAPAELRAKVKTICLREITGDLARERYRLRRLWLEQFISSQLARAGFETVPSERVEDVLARARKQAGGMHDPFTGRVMPAKREAVLRAERSALSAELGCEATLAPAIHVVRMRWQQGVASWDYVDHALGGGGAYLGTAQALSLWLELRSISGLPLLERAGGIQSLSTLEGGLFSDPEWRDATPEHLLGNAMWNARGVIAALGALAPPPSPEVAQCIARVTKKVDPVAQRAQCESEAFVFVPPPERKDEARAKGDEPAPAPE